MKVVLISGLKRSGKDYVSDMLKITKLSFAKPLKMILAETLSLKMSELENFKNQELDIKVGNLICTDFRTALQKFGTEVMQSWFGKDVWVDLLIDNLPDVECVVVSDWRFKREYEVLSEKFDVFTVRVEDYNLTPDEHKSEQDLLDFKFDYKIDNSNKGFVDIKPIKVWLGIS